MPRRRWGGSLAAGTTALCGLAVAASVISFLRHATGVVLFPYELAAGEELLLRDAVHLLSGRAVYTDVNQFPFLVSNYPPLFALASSLLIPLTGVSLTATRLVSTLSTLLCACLIGLIVHQQSGAKVPGALCGGAFLGSIFVYQWGAWGRVDSMAILLSLAAVLVVSRWQSWWGVCLGALFCLLSLYTKQTQFAAPVAILVWLLWRREGRRALVFATLWGGLGGLLFLLINLVSSGEFFRDVVVYNTLAYSPRAVLGYWRSFGLTHGVVLGVALACGVRYWRAGSITPAALYFLVSLGTTVLVGRAGASTNYFLEPIAASLILYGVYWGSVSRQRPRGGAVLALALLGQLLWFRIFPLTPLRVWYDPLTSFGYTPTPVDTLSCQRIDGYVAGVEGPILTEGGGFALKNGKELVASPWLLSALGDRGLVDDGLASLEYLIGERSFSLAVLTWQSYPPRILNTVWANYDRVDTVDCVFTYEIFLPKREA